MTNMTSHSQPVLAQTAIGEAAPSAAHTPGPWVYYADLPSTEPDWHIVTTANRLRVLANVHIEPGNEVDEANARLIAAAPDLLEALLCVQASTEWSCMEADTQGAVLAAIAKAAGAPQSRPQTLTDGSQVEPSTAGYVPTNNSSGDA